jgi:hypothetical protein
VTARTDHLAFARALGHELRAQRRLYEMTHEALAAQLPSAIRPSTIRSYEIATRHPTALRLFELCAALQVPADEMMRRALDRAALQSTDSVHVDIYALLQLALRALGKLGRFLWERLDPPPKGTAILRLDGDALQAIAKALRLRPAALRAFLMRFPPQMHEMPPPRTDRGERRRRQSV